MRCPLLDIELALEACPASTCRYNMEGACKFNQMKEVLEGEDKEEALAALGVSVEEAKEAANRIKAFVYTDKYCQYALGKGLDSAGKKELEALHEDPERYKRWPLAKDGKFPSVQIVLKLVEKRKHL